jgi:heme exporter protein D
MNWSEFFEMGGYALYVWPAYGLMAVVLAFNLVVPFRRRDEVIRKIRRLWAQAEKKA